MTGLKLNFYLVPTTVEELNDIDLFEQNLDQYLDKNAEPKKPHPIKSSMYDPSNDFCIYITEEMDAEQRRMEVIGKIWTLTHDDRSLSGITEIVSRKLDTLKHEHKGSDTAISKYTETTYSFVSSWMVQKKELEGDAF